MSPLTLNNLAASLSDKRLLSYIPGTCASSTSLNFITTTKPTPPHSPPRPTAPPHPCASSSPPAAATAAARRGGRSGACWLWVGRGFILGGCKWMLLMHHWLSFYYLFKKTWCKVLKHHKRFQMILKESQNKTCPPPSTNWH